MQKKILQIFFMICLFCLFLFNCTGSVLIGNINKYKMAIIMPGAVNDQDYNQLAFQTGEAIKAEYGIQVGYYEKISVPTVSGKVGQLNKEGINIIWLHGGQYDSQVYGLASKYPQISFIMEGDQRPDTIPINIWFIDRNFEKGMYVIGRLAATETKTGKIGYLCGLNLPFSFIEIHAIQQAVNDSGKDVTILPVWTGDFNDPEVARLATVDLIDQDVDVIIGSLNSGMEGVITAINDSKKEIKFTAKYIDKKSLSPEYYLTSLLMDFQNPLKEIFNSIIHKNTSGYYPMDFNKGLLIQIPIHNVENLVNTDMLRIIAEVKNGSIIVEKDSQPIEPTPAQD